MKSFRRRHYLVHHLQFRLLAAVLVYFLVAVAGVVVVLFGPLVLNFLGNPEYSTENYDAAGVFLRLHLHFWPLVLLIAIVIIFHSIQISHRIAGPLYRFRKVFAAVANGDLSVNSRIRRKDYLKGEAEALEEMISSLRSQIRSLQTDLAELSATSEQLSGPDSARADFNARLQKLQKRLDFYHLPRVSN